jgi:hypothetical protein
MAENEKDPGIDFAKVLSEHRDAINQLLQIVQAHDGILQGHDDKLSVLADGHQKMIDGITGVANDHAKMTRLGAIKDKYGPKVAEIEHMLPLMGINDWPTALHSVLEKESASHPAWDGTAEEGVVDREIQALKDHASKIASALGGKPVEASLTVAKEGEAPAGGAEHEEPDGDEEDMDDEDEVDPDPEATAKLIEETKKARARASIR